MGGIVVTALAPVSTLAGAVRSFEPHLQDSGEMVDVVFGEPTQYGTAYHALCQAVLAEVGPEPERGAHADRAARGLDAALRHVEDPTLPATLATFRRETGAVSRVNHRDFFWPPILKTYGILRRLGLACAPDLEGRIRAVDPARSFRARPPSNWAMVWLSGEWLRMRAGLAPTTQEQFDAWLAPYFQGPVLLPLGLYQEPGLPNSYDLFTRYHMADVLCHGYEGAWRTEMELLLQTGLRRSLAVQLSDGSLASAHRSTGQTWTVGAECAYFTLAGNWFRGRDPALAERAHAAAARAFASFRRWQRPGGVYSPVENLLPPVWRVGYEGYTADGHYGNLALGFLAAAIAEGLAVPDGDPPARATARHIEGAPTQRALCHRGPYSVQLNGQPAPHYDGFGLVDLTFGPGRLLQIASSMRYLGAPDAFYNPGLALRPGPGRTELRPVSQEPMDLLGPIEPGPGLASLRLAARVREGPDRYALAVDVEPDGVWVKEDTPGVAGHRTLLLPYPRDCGSGATTAVAVHREDGRAVVELGLGTELVRVQVDAEVESVLNLPYGFENRRGLGGLLRLDLARICEEVRWRAAVVR